MTSLSNCTMLSRNWPRRRNSGLPLNRNSHWPAQRPGTARRTLWPALTSCQGSCSANKTNISSSKNDTTTKEGNSKSCSSSWPNSKTDSNRWTKTGSRNYPISNTWLQLRRNRSTVRSSTTKLCRSQHRPTRTCWSTAGTSCCRRSLETSLKSSISRRI